MRRRLCASCSPLACGFSRLFDRRLRGDGDRRRIVIAVVRVWLWDQRIGHGMDPRSRRKSFALLWMAGRGHAPLPLASVGVVGIAQTSRLSRALCAFWFPLSQHSRRGSVRRIENDADAALRWRGHSIERSLPALAADAEPAAQEAMGPIRVLDQPHTDGLLPSRRMGGLVSRAGQAAAAVLRGGRARADPSTTPVARRVRGGGLVARCCRRLGEDRRSSPRAKGHEAHDEAAHAALDCAGVPRLRRVREESRDAPMLKGPGAPGELCPRSGRGVRRRAGRNISGGVWSPRQPATQLACSDASRSTSRYSLRVALLARFLPACSVDQTPS